jgi:hypothetical protein
LQFGHAYAAPFLLVVDQESPLWHLSSAHVRQTPPSRGQPLVSVAHAQRVDSSS